MDFEKEYKNLVAKVKNAHLYAQTDSTKNVLEDILPELRENEDERARKAALEGIEYLERKLGWDAIGDTDILDVKEYLEKQKEHHIPWYDYQKSKEAGYTIVPNEEYEQLIKQKEQKPEDKEITLTNFEEVLNTFLFDFANSPIKDCEPKEYTKKHSAEILKAAYAELNAQLKQDIFEAQQEGRREGYEAAKAEQKPAEIDFEDWDTLGYIRDIVRKHVRRDKEFNVLDKWLTEHYVNQKPAWDKYQQELEATDRWQEGYEAGFNAASKPTEWSEEDERYVNGLIGLIEDMKVGISPKLRGVTADKCIAFLKSLRPSWKPSEEQTEALRYVAYEHGNSSLSPYSIANKTLASLYEQLKKL